MSQKQSYKTRSSTRHTICNQSENSQQRLTGETDQRLGRHAVDVSFHWWSAADLTKSLKHIRVFYSS